MGRISAIALQRALAEGRRRATRFDVVLTLQYTALRLDEAPVTGRGESVNISRTGLLFRCDARPQQGDSMLVVVDWPVAAQDNEPLKLLITGHVVRIKRPLVAISMHSHRLLRAHELDKRFEASSWRFPKNGGVEQAHSDVGR